MHPACPNKKQNHLQNSLLRRTQFWVRKSFSKPASLKRASLVGRLVGDQERNKSSYAQTKFDNNQGKKTDAQQVPTYSGHRQQTPGGIARTAPNAKRSHQLLLAKKYGLRSDRNYYMPSNLAEAMIRSLDDSSNQGLHLLNQTLRNSEHVLDRVWSVN